MRSIKISSMPRLIPPALSLEVKLVKPRRRRVRKLGSFRISSRTSGTCFSQRCKVGLCSITRSGISRRSLVRLILSEVSEAIAGRLTTLARAICQARLINNLFRKLMAFTDITLILPANNFSFSSITLQE